MPLELFIALRYLTASRKRAHVALVSAIAIGGLALGVAALVVSIALLTGFQDKIRERLRDGTPHLLVSPSRGALFEEPAAIETALRRLPGVLSAEPVVEGRGWIADAGARSALPVRYRSSSAARVSSGEVEVAAGIAGQLGVGRGAAIQLVSSRTLLSPLGPIPLTLRLKVAGIRRATLYDRAGDVEVSLDAARRLAGTRQGVSSYEVRLKRPTHAEEAAKTLARALGGRASVKTWMDLNAGLTFALRMEKVLIFVTVFLIVLVASFNVVSDLSLLVVEKRRDLGVLATLGASRSVLARIYWWLGLAVGGVGTLAGAAAGTLITEVLDRFALVPLPADVYLLSHIPFALHGRDLFLVVVFSLATAVGASAAPARSAARVGPAEAVRLSR